MGRLPTAKDLGVRSFQDRSTVVTPRVDTSGQNKLASAISNISQGMNERLDASSLHKAKIHFQKAKLEADAAFDQDPDFETYQQRYDEKMKTAMSDAADLVRNPKDRDIFSRDMSLYRAQGNQMMIAKAFGKEAEKGLADLDETLTIGRENYLRSSNQDDKQFAIDTVNEAINAAEESTHIDADKAQAMRQALALDLAIASVEAAPPEKQIELLKSRSGVMEYMPLDVRAKMLKNAETQFSAQTALDTANLIREEGGTREERLDKVHKIKDPKVKAATKSQVINDFNLEKTSEGEEKYSIYDEAAKGLIAGGDLSSYIAQNPDQWNKLGSKEQSALIGMTTSRTPSKTDFSVYHKLNQLKQQDKVKAYHYFLDNVSAFSIGDAKSESDYFTGLAEEPKPLFSMKETFTKRAKILNIKDEDLGLAIYRIQEEYNTWQKANPGGDMTLAEENATVNAVFDKVVGSSPWYASDKRAFELPKADVDKVKLEKEIARYAKERNDGVEPDLDTKLRIRDVMVKRGLISEYGGQ
jgi:hypothetical protein